MNETFKSVILAFRPKTLTAAVVPCIAGTALAAHLGFWHPQQLIWALLASLFIQIGTNLVNDAADFKKGADTKERLGPRRITQAGVLNYKQVMGLGTISFLLALLCGIPIVLQGGVAFVVLGLVSIALGYAYTTGPYPLAYKGLGDFFVILFFGIIAVMGMTYLHTLNWSTEALVLGLQIGLLSAVLIAINNLRDHEGDRKVGKRTMAVRLGVQGAKYEILFFIWMPFVLGFYWLSVGPQKVFLFPLICLPLAFKISKEVLNNEPSAFYNTLLAKSAGLHLLFGVLAAVGFIL